MTLIASRREVAESFLRLEVDKGDSEAKELLSSTSPDDDFFHQLRQYAHNRKNAGLGTASVLIWVVGVHFDDRYLKVIRWHKIDVELSDLYSKGLNPMMQSDLESVGGNLKAFAGIVQSNPGRYPEFDGVYAPQDEHQRIIFGLLHGTSGHSGTIELLDGAHRTVYMLNHNINRTMAYLAELHKV